MSSTETEKRREIRLQARSWMVLNGIRGVDIERALGMKNHVTIADTLAGRRNNRRFLCYLLKQGCPATFLALPTSMEEAA